MFVFSFVWLARVTVEKIAFEVHSFAILSCCSLLRSLVMASEEEQLPYADDAFVVSSALYL